MPTRIRPRRRYTDTFRATALAALDANCGNLDRTARDLGVPRKTLTGWAAGRNNPPPAELRHQKKADLADELERYAVALCGVRPEQVGTLTLRDAAVALGIAVDKLLLLRSQPVPPPVEASPAEDYSKLSHEELHVLCELHRKAKGEPPLLMASDLDFPCVVDPDHPDGYWPNGEPPENPPDDPLAEHRKRWRHGLVR